MVARRRSADQTLRFTNMVDVFDKTAGVQYANAMTNTLMLDVSWSWLPKTAIFFNAQQGFVDYLNDLSRGNVSVLSALPHGRV